MTSLIKRGNVIYVQHCVAGKPTLRAGDGTVDARRLSPFSCIVAGGKSFQEETPAQAARLADRGHRNRIAVQAAQEPLPDSTHTAHLDIRANSQCTGRFQHRIHRHAQCDQL